MTMKGGYQVFKLSPHGDVSNVECGNPNYVLRLGHAARGNEEVQVPMSGAGQYVRCKSTPHGVVGVRFTEKYPSPAPCWASIATHGGYQKGRGYRFPAVEGATVVAEGYSADGAAGRACGGEHVLVLVQPGCEFELESKYDSRWFSWDGENWLVESPSVHAARLALLEVAAGGGEWL